MASVNFVIAQGQTGDGQFPQSIIVSSSTDTTPHLLKLKGTQQGDTETRVSGFSLDTTSAVGAQANSQLLVLVTDSSLRVTEAKVRTASNQFINLVPATSQQAGAFSLANLPGGVYTLDVITQKGNVKAAYEGVLSIGQQPATVIQETTKRVTNEYGDLYLIFLPPEECPPGTTGVPPDCIPDEECPPGTTGVPPDCVPIEECPAGQEGTPPDCGPPPEECPEGTRTPDCVGGGDGEENNGFLPPENGEEPPPEENEGEEGEDESSEDVEESEESDEGETEEEDAGGADEEDAN